MQTEVEATLIAEEDDAVAAVRSAFLLWGFGLLVIVGNLALNPLWEGHWYEKLWLPAIYVGALAVLLVSKYNRRTEHGRIIFEQGWIRIFPKDGDRMAYRMADLEDLRITSGKPGFFRNPLVKGTLGRIDFRLDGKNHAILFRLRRWEDAGLLHLLADPFL